MLNESNWFGDLNTRKSNYMAFQIKNNETKYIP